MICSFSAVHSMASGTGPIRVVPPCLTDKRGNRKGFPPDVLAELAGLEVYWLAIEKRDSAWADVSKRG